MNSLPAPKDPPRKPYSKLTDRVGTLEIQMVEHRRLTRWSVIAAFLSGVLAALSALELWWIMK